MQFTERELNQIIQIVRDMTSHMEIVARGVKGMSLIGYKQDMLQIEAKCEEQLKDLASLAKIKAEAKLADKPE